MAKVVEYTINAPVGTVVLVGGAKCSRVEGERWETVIGVRVGDRGHRRGAHHQLRLFLRLIIRVC